MKRLLAHPRLAAFRGIVANASSLVGTTAVTALLGFVYWWVAARLFTPEEVGFAAASISAMQLLGAVGTVGCGTLLIGELARRRGDAAVLTSTILAATGSLGLLLGGGFAILAPRLASDLGPLSSRPANIALFAVGTALTTATLVLDQAVLGLERGSFQFWRNAIFAATKLLILVPMARLLTDDHEIGIYATWVLGIVISLVWLAARVIKLGLRPRDLVPRPVLLRGLGRAAVEHHFLNLALQAPSLALPMVVTATLSSAQNAYFYTAWMLAGFVFVPPVALAISLYAAATSPESLARKLRFTLGAATAIGIVANIAIFGGAALILRPFGVAYADAAAWPLRIIALGVFGLIIKDHYVALCRINSRLTGAIPLIVIGSVAELALAALGATRAGLTGLALGWLIAISAQAVLMAPTLYRTARGGQAPTRQSEPDADPLGAVQPQHHLPWWAQPTAK
jgi:O-antigen/teichoic acid export membrane protein